MPIQSFRPAKGDIPKLNMSIFSIDNVPLTTASNDGDAAYFHSSNNCSIVRNNVMLHTNVAAGTALASIVGQNGRSFIGGSTFFKKSDDFGVTWDTITTTLLGTQDITALGADKKGNVCAKAVGFAGTATFSSDNGDNWIACPSLADNVAASGQPSQMRYLPIIDRWYCVHLGIQLSQSTDGFSWATAVMGGVLNNCASIEEFLGALYTCDTVGRIYRSDDGGLTWTSLVSTQFYNNTSGSSGGDFTLKTLHVFDGRLYAFGGRGAAMFSDDGLNFLPLTMSSQQIGSEQAIDFDGRLWVAGNGNILVSLNE